MILDLTLIEEPLCVQQGGAGPQTARRVCMAVTRAPEPEKTIKDGGIYHCDYWDIIECTAVSRAPGPEKLI